MLVHLVRKKSHESSLSRIAKRVAASFFDLVSVSKEKASLPEGWEEGKLPFCKSIPRVLPGCPESSSSQGAFANYSAAPAAVGRSSTSCEKRAPPARTMQSQEVVALSKEKEASIELWIALCKKTYTIHTCEYFVCWDHHQGQISLSTFSNASSLRFFLMRDNDRHE